MDRFDRPDFGPRGFFVDPGFLPPGRMLELRKRLPRRLANAPAGSELAMRADAFLDEVSSAVHVAWTTRPTVAPAELLRELRALALKSDDLMRYLHALSADAVSAFHAYFDELALVRPDLRYRSDGLSDLGASLWAHDGGPFLAAIWELLADIETAANYAAAHVVAPSRQVKVSEAAMRGLVASVARAWRAQAGRWPGHSKGTWFPGFMRELVRGEPFRTRCGPELVASVLADLRATAPDPPA